MNKPVKNLETPCIGICSTIYGDEVCRGCKRFCDEIIEWNTYNDNQKAAVLARLEQLTAIATDRKLIITNAKLLKKTCLEQQIKIRHDFDPLCWAYVLIRDRAEQITDVNAFGIEIKTDFANLSLREISNLIDEDLYAISEKAQKG